MADWKIIFIDVLGNEKHEFISAKKLNDAFLKFESSNDFIKIIGISRLGIRDSKSEGNNQDYSERNSNKQYNYDLSKNTYTIIDAATDAVTLFIISISTIILSKYLLDSIKLDWMEKSSINQVIWYCSIIFNNIFMFYSTLIILPPVISSILSGVIFILIVRMGYTYDIKYEPMNSFILCSGGFTIIYLVIFRLASMLHNAYGSFSIKKYTLLFGYIGLVSCVLLYLSPQITQLLLHNNEITTNKTTLRQAINSDQPSSQIQNLTSLDRKNTNEPIIEEVISPRKYEADEITNQEYEVRCPVKKQKIKKITVIEKSYIKSVYANIMSEINKMEDLTKHINSDSGIVGFKIDDSGRLISAKICKFSGSSQADEIALAAIKNASPFAKPINTQQRNLIFNYKFTEHDSATSDKNLYENEFSNPNQRTYNRSRGINGNIPINDVINILQIIPSFVR